MPGLRYVAGLCLAAAAMAALPAAALAVDANLIFAAEEEAEAEEVVAPSDGVEIVPAEEAPVTGADEPAQPWPARFLAPLLLVIGIVGLGLVCSAYALRVRGRYRVVE